MAFDSAPGDRIAATMDGDPRGPSARSVAAILAALVAAVLLASPIPFEQEASFILLRSIAAPILWLTALGLSIRAVSRSAPFGRRAALPVAAVGLAAVALHHGAAALGMGVGPSRIGIPGWRNAVFLIAAAGAAWLAGLSSGRLGGPSRANAAAVWIGMICAGAGIVALFAGASVLATGWVIPGILYLAPFCGMIVTSFLHGALRFAPHSSMTAP